MQIPGNKSQASDLSSHTQVHSEKKNFFWSGLYTFDPYPQVVSSQILHIPFFG